MISLNPLRSTPWFLAPRQIKTAREAFALLRADCPVAWTEALDGYWSVAGNREVREVARDDATYFPEKDQRTRA
jgi:hypothetical protein